MLINIYVQSNKSNYPFTSIEYSIVLVTLWPDSLNTYTNWASYNHPQSIKIDVSSKKFSELNQQNQKAKSHPANAMTARRRPGRPRKHNKEPVHNGSQIHLKEQKSKHKDPPETVEADLVQTSEPDFVATSEADPIATPEADPINTAESTEDVQKLKKKTKTKKRFYPKQKYKCPNKGCSHSFKFRANLNRHLNCECGIMPHFKCGYCDYVTHYEVSVKKHSKRRHKDQPVSISDIRVNPDNCFWLSWVQWTVNFEIFRNVQVFKLRVSICGFPEKLYNCIFHVSFIIMYEKEIKGIENVLYGLNTSSNNLQCNNNWY